MERRDVAGEVVCKVSLDPYWRIWAKIKGTGNFENSFYYNGQGHNTKNEYNCKNNAPKSMLICHAKKGTLISLYDYKYPTTTRKDDRATIRVEGDLGNNCVPVWTFEKTYSINETATGIIYAEVTYFPYNEYPIIYPPGLDGRVTSLRVDFEYDRPATRPLLGEN